MVKGTLELWGDDLPRPGRCASLTVLRERVLPMGSSSQLCWSFYLDLGDGRTRGLRHTGIQDDPVAGEAGPRGPRAGAGRVLRKGMYLPSREGAPRQGFSDGFGCGLASRRPRAAFITEVAEPFLVESALHAKPPAIVLGGVVPDGLVATFHLASPPGLVRSVPLEPGSARSGGTPKATTAREGEKGREREREGERDHA